VKIKVKGKKFTFVYPDFEYSITKKGLKPEPGGWYHEGIAQLAAIIEKKGWKVSLIHLTKPLKYNEYKKLLDKHNPDILGFSIRTGVREYGKKLIKWTDKYNSRIFKLVGSYHSTLWPEEVIEWQGLDAICIGEAENPIIKFLDAVNKGKSILKTGSFWIKDKKGKFTKTRLNV